MSTTIPAAAGSEHRPAVTSGGRNARSIPSPPGGADSELLARSARGDADALAALYDRHAAAAFALAMRMCRSRPAAEEICQEAFLSVWRSADRYDPARGSARTWLLGVVHNRAIDHLRRSATRDRLRASDDGITERVPAPERTDAQAAQHEEAAAARAALDGLPPTQRQAVELAYFAGLTHTEIAVRLRVPTGTVKSRIRLALHKLREQLIAAPDGPLAPS